MSKKNNLIGFWSYGGGTGTTLTAVNLAVALSRIGKKVLLMDCSFTSPGVHWLLPSVFENGVIKKGLANFLVVDGHI